MSAAPFDVLRHFDADEEELELHEVQVSREWLPVPEGYRQLDSTVLVMYHSHGVEKIAVKHEEGRIVEFDLREIIVRDGSPLTTVER